MPSLRLIRLCLLVGVLLPAGCRDYSTEPFPEHFILITLESSPALAGEETVLSYQARAQELREIRVEFGDGDEFVLPAHGERELQGSVVHVYGEPGTYMVLGHATDASGATATGHLFVSVEF